MHELIFLIILIILILLILIISSCNSSDDSSGGLHSVEVKVNTFEDTSPSDIGNGGIFYSVSPDGKITIIPYRSLPNGEGLEVKVNSKINPLIYWVEDVSQIQRYPSPTSEFPDPVLRFDPSRFNDESFSVKLDTGSYFYLKTTSLADGSIETIFRYKWPIKTNSITTLPIETRQFLNSNAVNIPLTNSQPPSTFDSRQKWPNAITNPLDQLNCGSCWAFSTSTCLSDRFRIRNANTPDASPMVKELYQKFTYVISEGTSYQSLNNVSPYQVVRCTNCPPGTTGRICEQGCGGGVIAQALQYLINTGANSILSVRSQPLDPSVPISPCTLDKNKSVYKGIKLGKVSEMNSHEATPQEKQLAIMRTKQEIYANGPVCTGYTVYNDFYNYKTGVYDGGSGGVAGGHAVVIIGWGVENGKEYWLVRNSWGISWALEGYFKIAIDWTPPNKLDSNNNPTLGILDEIWTLAVA